MRYKSFLFGCFSAVLIAFTIGYVKTRSGNYPATVLFDEIVIIKGKCNIFPEMGDMMFLNYREHTLALFSFDDEVFKTVDFGGLKAVNGHDYSSEYHGKYLFGLPAFSLTINNSNNKCVYFDLDINGTFDKKDSSKQDHKIWLNNSWVSATPKKTTTQMRVGSRLYEFNRKTGIWEVIDDEN